MTVLHDGVTLQHFGIVDRLDICQSQHAHFPEPRWTEGVEREVRVGAQKNLSHCTAVMACAWLGAPATPTAKENKAIYKLHVGLNEGRRPPIEDYGEAESIFFAEKHGGRFATDDAGAFDFARRRQSLGPGRVFDSVEILRSAVAEAAISAKDAADLANQIVARGRHLRRCHAGKLTPSYFQ